VARAKSCLARRMRNNRSVALAPQPDPRSMKFVTGGVFGNPEATARNLLELAQAFEPVQDRRIYVDKINAPMLYEQKATPERRPQSCD
jgi:hypothetical protein